MDEFETYEDVIDAYNANDMGYSTLTDYIKGQNIKIKEISMEPLADLQKSLFESKADGGSVGIEVLFGPKVPAAPSQLVSESDILLGYRGDAGYRSGSEQSKSIGQGNVGSKASFGGGKGVDKSGRSEGAGGVNTRQYTTDQQNINQIKANLGIKDPNLLQKTFNKYNSLPFYIKGPLNTMVPTEYMKLFNIGNAINTGVNQMNNPDFTEEDLTLGATKEISFEGNSPFMRDQINERIIAAENEYYKQGKMPPEFLGDKIRMNMEIANQKGYMGPGFEDGGRVGFFMGGPALEGQALSIYDSMKAYGATDQAIADRLSSLGLYDPNASTPEAGDNIIGSQLNQGGGGERRGGIMDLDPYRTKTTPMDPNSFLGKTFSKIGDFAGSMFDKFSGTKVGEGITSGATKFKNIAFTPMMALANMRNPLNPNAQNYNPSLQGQIDFLEGATGSRITGTGDDLTVTEDLAMIGRDPNSGLAKYGPGSVLAGQNVVSGFGTNDYEDQLQNYIDKMISRGTLSPFQKAKLDQAYKELENARAGAQARIDALNKQKAEAKAAENAELARKLQIAAAAKAQEISRKEAAQQQAAIERQGRDSGPGRGDAGNPGGSSGAMTDDNAGTFCFDPNTLVQMADGSEKKIKEIQLGDQTKGGEVTGVFQFKASDEIHDYKGVTVAGSHYVKENGRFIMVQDSPISVKIDKIPVVYSLDTTDRRIFIKDIEFADYNGDGIAKGFLANAGVNLTGFDKEVLRQVENRLI